MAPCLPTLCKAPSALAALTPKDDQGCGATGGIPLAPACRLKLTFLTGAWRGTFAWVICQDGRILP